jgi:hypothetical protein
MLCLEFLIDQIVQTVENGIDLLLFDAALTCDRFYKFGLAHTFIASHEGLLWGNHYGLQGSGEKSLQFPLFYKRTGGLSVMGKSRLERQKRLLLQPGAWRF